MADNSWLMFCGITVAVMAWSYFDAKERVRPFIKDDAPKKNKSSSLDSDE